MRKLSVVVPVYQDELSIKQNFLILKEVLDRASSLFNYEVILVNDGSKDNSILVLEELHSEHPRSTGVINLTRNFGQVAAITAGLGRCTGDCAVVISSDLQDPPELIPEMFTEWLAGGMTVVGIRESREDSSFSRLASHFFYRLMRRYAVTGIPPGGFDFFLLDRMVIDRVLNSSERNGFLQGKNYADPVQTTCPANWQIWLDAVSKNQVFCRWLCCLFFCAYPADHIVRRYSIFPRPTVVYGAGDPAARFWDRSPRLELRYDCAARSPWI
jgi:glycosyltransferase involved in cell wall biosynthesis